MFSGSIQRSTFKRCLKSYIIAYSSVHDKTDYDKVMEELEVDEELKKRYKKKEIRQSLKSFRVCTGRENR